MERDSNASPILQGQKSCIRKIIGTKEAIGTAPKSDRCGIEINISLSEGVKTQTLLVPGEYHGKTISEDVIKSFRWPETTRILDEHDGREIGHAMLHLSNSTVEFVYRLDEEIDNAGWSASMDVKLDKNTGEVLEITNLDHIALTRTPTVTQAKMRLSEEEQKMSDKEIKDLKELVKSTTEVVESMRLELSEIKKQLEKNNSLKEPQRPLHERLDLSLGETPTVEEIVRAGLDAGVF